MTLAVAILTGLIVLAGLGYSAARYRETTMPVALSVLGSIMFIVLYDAAVSWAYIPFVFAVAGAASWVHAHAAGLGAKHRGVVMVIKEKLP